jgi:hypothetical protein
MTMKKVFFFLLKLSVSAVVLWLLVSSVDVGRMLGHIGQVPLLTFILVSVLWLAATFVATLRWNLLLRDVGIEIPIIRLLAYNFSYNFYSIALPGGKAAAEAIRLYQILKDNPGDVRSGLIVPTLFDRMSTVFVSLLAAILFFAFSPGVTTQFPWWLPYAGIASIAVVIASIAFPFERLFGMRQKADAPSFITSMRHALVSYRGKPFLLGQVFFLTLLMNAIMAFGVYILSSSLAVPASYVLVFFLFSVGMTSAFLPITIGGIGVREGVLAYLLSVVAGVPLEVGATVSLMALAASLLGTFFGAGIEFHRHFIRHDA